MDLSIIIPAYNESLNIAETIREIVDVLNADHWKDKFEIIVVDDHSDDDTFGVVQKLQNRSTQCLRLSRRSGSHVAIRAGMAHARGQAVIFLSADGQDDPHVFLAMIQQWQMGSHVVWALRRERQEPFWIKFPALIFYRLLRQITDVRSMGIDISRICFCLMDRKVVDAVNSYKAQRTSLIGLLFWIGFRHNYVEYDRRQRRAGSSKWNFRSRLALAFDWIMAFSDFPLQLSISVGCFVFFIELIFAIWLAADYGSAHLLSKGSLLIWLVLFLGGSQLVAIGMVGKYLARNSEQSSQVPLYFIERTTTNR